MSLQVIMQVWGIVALLLSGAAFALLLTRKREDAGTRPPRKALLDFSANQEEGLQMQQRLADALAGSATDAEFEPSSRLLAARFLADIPRRYRLK